VKGLYLYYKLHMTNGDDLLHEEFSADEFYILLIDIIFFILYIKIMVLSIICAVVLKKRQLLHTTYRLYLASVTLWTIHLLCMVIAWGSYGTTGWEMRRMEVLGRCQYTFKPLSQAHYSDCIDVNTHSSLCLKLTTVIA
ncbi:transmembrane protein 145, partial [Plakobranchus ocellatus]